MTTKSIPTNAGEPRLRVMIGPDLQHQLSNALRQDYSVRGGEFVGAITMSPEHTITTKPTVMGIPLIVSEQVDGDAVYLCFPTHNIKA